MPLNSVTILLDNPRAIYHQGDQISGTLVVENKYELKHEGLLLSAEGQVSIKTNFKRLNLRDAFTSSNKSIPLLDFAYELIPAGRLQSGQTEVP